MTQNSPKIVPLSKFTNVIDILTKMAMNSALSNKHAACLFRGDEIFSFGVNKYFNAKFSNQTFYLGVHAEVDALSCLGSKAVKGMDILIIRCNKGKLQNSRPCNACVTKLQQRGIRKAFYSNSNGEIVYELVDEMPKLHESAGVRVRNNLENLNCCK